MKIEELLPEIRAGKKFRLATLDKDVFIRYVENDIAADSYEQGAIEPYTGFIATKDDTEYLWDMPGDLMFSDDWELYLQESKPPKALTPGTVHKGSPYRDGDWFESCKSDDHD